MRFQDAELERLFDSAVLARRHSIAVCIAGALRDVNPAAPSTPYDLARGADAHAACEFADKALDDYQRERRAN